MIDRTLALARLVLAHLVATLRGAGYLARALHASELGALTLAEAAKLSNDIVLQGVYESIINTDDLAGAIPYDEMMGNSITYNRENAAATVAWRAVGDTWTEDVPTYTQVTTQLTIVGGDADVDNYIQRSRSNVQDIAATVLMGKTQALAREWGDKLINGTGAANQPTGAKNLITAGQTLANGANGAALTLEILDTLIDQVKGGKPDAIVMSKRERRSINKLARAAGTFLETQRNEFGRMISFYDGIPILLNDYIAINETVGTSVDCARLYALSFGQEVGGLGALFSPGPDGEVVQIEDIGSLETKDATRRRVKAYLTLAMYGTLKCAMSTGIRPAA